MIRGQKIWLNLSLKHFVLNSSMKKVVRFLRGKFKNFDHVYCIMKSLQADCTYYFINKVRIFFKKTIVPSEVEILDIIRVKIHARRVNLGWPKKELHILLIYGLSNWEWILPMAFSRFGKVHVFDWRAEGYDDRVVSDWPSSRHKLNQSLIEKFHQINSIEKIDVVIGQFSGYTIMPETIDEIKAGGAITINWTFDDKLNFKGKKMFGVQSSPAGLCDAVDITLTSNPSAIRQYWSFGGLSMFVPEAAEHNFFKRSNQKKYKVTFVGARYGNRPKFISDLKKYGVDVECFGVGWKNGEISDIRMAEIFSQSLINIGMSEIGYSKKLCCLKARDFEIPLCGSLYLTSYHSDLDLVYEIGKEILVYRNAKDCAALIKKILNNPLEYESISKEGFRRASLNHTYEARWSVVFKKIGAII